MPDSKSSPALSPERQKRLDSQGGLCRIGDAPKLKSTVAAYLRAIGLYIDSADVIPPDLGKLTARDAQKLRSSGVFVQDDEIEP